MAVTEGSHSARLRVLDLFSGLGGWSAAFKDRGHDVVTVDFNPDFKPTIAADVLELRPDQVPGPWDVILASPPCECFSMAAGDSHWLPGYVPKPTAEHAIRIVAASLKLIQDLAPRYWVMENPRAMLRKISFMGKYPRKTVTYCQFGDTSMKPTDLWGRFPPNLRLPPMCSNGDSCHEAAPRGSKTGTQGKNGAADRAVVPYALSLRVCLALENLTERPETPLAVMA